MANIVGSPSHLVARLLSWEERSELDACFRLRHGYFVKQRGWVKAENGLDERESDAYDEHCLHLAVFKGSEVKAYLRALPFMPEVGWMLDREFAPLLREEERRCLVREGALELSRLVVCDDIADSHPQDEPHPVEHLLKQLYGGSLQHGYGQFHIVVEEAWPVMLRRRFGLPFRAMGAPYSFPDGTRTVAATASLSELENGMRRFSVRRYAWYRGQEVQDG